MIWRASRPTRFHEGATLPYEGPDGIVVGALDLAMLRDLSIWRRLVQTSLPDEPLTTLLIADDWSPKAKRSASAAFPPSDLEGICFVKDGDGRWQAALGDDTLFLALMREGRVPLLILGAPTDEAWDRLEDAVKGH